MNKLLTVLVLVLVLAACGQADADTPQTAPGKPSTGEAPAAQVQGSTPQEGSMMYEMNIEGMHCHNCAGSVKRTLESQPGVASAEVKLEQKVAVITVKPGAKFDEQAAIAAVNKDFEVKSCKPVATQ